VTRKAVRMRAFPTLIAVLSLAVLAPAAHAEPPLCTADVIETTLIGAGKLTQEEIDLDAGVDVVRCGDVTGDGATDALFTLGSGGTAGDTRFGVIEGGADGVSDALFTLASGGTAGDTRFGVLKGNADGTLGARILFKQGYKVGIARHSSRAFDVMQPYYAADDPNCCPSSFRQTRYTFSGGKFKAGKAKKLKKAPARFYRP